MKTVILAGSIGEHNKFASQEGIRGAWHIVNRDRLRGLRPQVIHILPSYFARRDRHAIEAELRHIRRRSKPQEILWVKVGDHWEPDEAQEQTATPVAVAESASTDNSEGPHVHIESTEPVQLGEPHIRFDHDASDAVAAVEEALENVDAEKVAADDAAATELQRTIEDEEKATEDFLDFISGDES